jgi:zinc transport system substrate-binding protein
VRGSLPRRALASFVAPLALVALVILVATPAAVAGAGEPLQVYTVNYPLAYFAERIGGSEVKVVFPAPPDVDPAFWNPDTATLQRYQRADLVLLNGAGYARWVKRASLPRRRVVDTSRGFRDRYIATRSVTAHSHSGSGQHSHTGTAFVTWLDFDQAREQARAIADALIRTRPELRDRFEASFAQLTRDLEAFDAELREAFAPLAGQPLLASHPIYQYLARAYGLDLKAVTWEPDEDPKASAWRHLEQLRESYPARWMLWEAAPRRETESKLRSLGVRSIVFAPCANRPATGDFLSAMRANLAALRTAQRERKPGD